MINVRKFITKGRSYLTPGNVLLYIVFKLYKDVSKLGFDAVIRNKTVKKIAHEILLLSENGLKNRNKMNIHNTKENECEFLSPLFSSLDQGISLADEILIKYNKDWSKDLKQIYNEYSY